MWNRGANWRLASRTLPVALPSSCRHVSASAPVESTSTVRSRCGHGAVLLGTVRKVTDEDGTVYEEADEFHIKWGSSNSATFRVGDFVYLTGEAQDSPALIARICTPSPWIQVAPPPGTCCRPRCVLFSTALPPRVALRGQPPGALFGAA